MARMTRASTVPSPTPASKTLTDGGRGWILASSMPTRCATTHFSLQVLTNSRYFWRLKWMDIGEFHADALRDHPLLAASVDEQQVLLAVVVEAEIGLRLVLRPGGNRKLGPGLLRYRSPRARQAPGRGPQPHQAPGLDRPAFRHQRAHALPGLHGHT